MEEQKKSLHVKRLREALKEIASLSNENVHGSRFNSWRRRVDTSLKELFPLDHNYVYGFQCLKFWHERVEVEPDEWDEEDQEQYERDLEQAGQIIADALEEYEHAPPTPQPVARAVPPSIQIIVQTSLAQITTISLAQVIDSIGQLGLTSGDQEQARKLAQQFEAEAKTQEPWSVLGKTVDGFKKLGKDAYEKIAIPLILAYLKQQTGLGSL